MNIPNIPNIPTTFNKLPKQNLTHYFWESSNSSNSQS